MPWARSWNRTWHSHVKCAGKPQCTPGTCHSLESLSPSGSATGRRCRCLELWASGTEALVHFLQAEHFAVSRPEDANGIDLSLLGPVENN